MDKMRGVCKSEKKNQGVSGRGVRKNKGGR